ncbi:lytic transglycosylase [Xinfangfangia sp. CPCC 101601]|uniref:Lytic transglycosylase n=1 Tax=Pseudogemmobacter lacusdianii TaxID=3069608 RepID=A0ABU0VX11_9RHOB|nr:lytic transglycosylase [Xinfangfangia sp. CPCC 101601]MDQ2066282.1 lytic transglycosylase [Xinfangfangia sp. CPCC 101601]
MSRFLRASILLLSLAACGGGSRQFEAPRKLDDACAIVAERPQYLRAMRATERKWGVPIHVQMAVIHQESKFIGNAQTPHRFALGVIPMGRQSTAYGYSQALNGTWEEYQKSEGRGRAKRDRITDATDFMGWYFTETTRKLGIPLSDAQGQYLAYHEGRSGYSRQSYLSKPWLVEVAAKVKRRSEMYESQLNGCRR